MRYRDGLDPPNLRFTLALHKIITMLENWGSALLTVHTPVFSVFKIQVETKGKLGGKNRTSTSRQVWGSYWRMI